MLGYHIRIVLHPNTPLSANNTFVPTSLFQHLPAQTPQQTARRNALFNPKPKDYRYGPIRLDWLDFDKTSTSMVNVREKGPGRGTATATFVPHTRTKSGSTNLPEGTVHVYRESATKPPPSLETSTSSASTPAVIEDTDDASGVMLAVLAVPAWMAPSDFLTFVAPAAEGISHLRMIRDSAPNRSIAVVNFAKVADAAEFTEAYNGKPFNSMEPENCHVVHVLSVQIETDDAVAFATLKRGSLQGAMYELPTCPVCLERMDSAVTGLITVPCSHTFHCMCLSKWGDSRCPVCRYSQTLMSSHPTSSANRARPIPFANASNSTPSLSACVDCSSTTNLWICLICGNIGCGRYGRAHAHAHYEHTTHLYALELETQRVWDYAGDGYVHRLIQNKADGKLVELPSASMGVREEGESGGRMGPGPADALSAEKIEAIGIEYSYLLTSQLDSQREYYEEQGAELKGQVAELRAMVQSLGGEVERERVGATEEREQRRKEEAAKLDEMHRDKIKAEKRAEKLADVAKKLEKELREERAVSEGLMKNLGKMKEKVELANTEKAQFRAQIAEKEDQVRDVMFFLEAKTKIEHGGGAEAEAAGGSVEIPTSPPPPSDKKKKSKKSKKS